MAGNQQGTRIDRLLARMKAARLDRELAAGVSPESSRPHAARASYLVSPPFRDELAGDWEHVLQIATGTAPPGQGRFVLRYDRIAGAEPQIRELIGLLRAPAPVSARGVATVSLLLTDGTGPLYNRLLPGQAVLSDAVATATALLDPAG